MFRSANRRKDSTAENFAWASRATDQQLAGTIEEKVRRFTSTSPFQFQRYHPHHLVVCVQEIMSRVQGTEGLEAHPALQPLAITFRAEAVDVSQHDQIVKAVQEYLKQRDDVKTQDLGSGVVALHAFTPED